MNHLWRWKAFTIPGPLSSYGIGGPSWGSLFTIPGSYKPGMAFDSSLARLLGTLLEHPQERYQVGRQAGIKAIPGL